jgi:hypothetical protein
MTGRDKTYNEKVADGLVEAEGKERLQVEEKLTLSTGVVVHAVKVPPFIVLKVLSRFVNPPVPFVMDEEKQREIQNPMDETYLADLKRIEDERNIAVLDALLAKGVVAEVVPDTVPDLNGGEWEEDVEFLIQEPVDRRKTPHFLAWLKYVVCAETADIEKLSVLVFNKFGVSGSTLEEAMNNFQREQGGEADPGLEA